MYLHNHAEVQVFYLELLNDVFRILSNMLTVHASLCWHSKNLEKTIFIM